MKLLKTAVVLLLVLLLAACGARDTGDTLPFSGGSGSAGDPYQLSTAEDLWELESRIRHGENGGQFAASHYVLTADIDLKNKAWDPIPTFSGVLDGAGHTISGIRVEYKTSLLGGELRHQHGFIGTLSGQVMDLTISDSFFSAIEEEVFEVGAFAGSVDKGVLINCSTTASVTVEGAYQIGGIAGNVNAGSKISCCTNAAAVTGTWNVSSTGGIAGRASCLVDSCVNTGTVTGAGDAAGIVCNSNMDIWNCINSGAVTAHGYAGGIAASFSDGSLNSSAGNPDIRIENCTNSGTIISETDPAGGIVGGCRTGSIVNCVNDGDVSGPVEVGGILAYFQASSFGAPCQRFVVSGCINNGSVSAPDDSYIYGAGGICSRVHGDQTELFFENCENHGAVTSGSASGGIVANGYVTVLQLSDCVNAGSIRGREYAGGLVGELKPTNEDTDAPIRFVAEGCINRGEVRADKSLGYDGGVFVAGILGHYNELVAERRFDEVSFTGCENTGDLIGAADSAAIYSDDHCGTYAAPPERLEKQ